MNDVMIDIETLGIRPTSVITQIGACYFDRNTGEIGDTFIRNLNVQEALKWGLTIDWKTVEWWYLQEQRSWLEKPMVFTKALGELHPFVKKAKYIWSHSTFDIPILANAYNVIGSYLPFHYRQTRDIRTLTHLAGHQRNKSKVDPNDKTHNALDDCIYQVKYCVECFNKLKGD